MPKKHEDALPLTKTLCLFWLVHPTRPHSVFYTLDDKHVARLVQLGLAHLGHQEAADRLSLVSALA